MSHLASIAIECRSLPAVKLACERLGWQFHEHKKTFKNYGRWVGDTEAPTDLIPETERIQFSQLSQRHQKQRLTELMARCDHAISVPGCDYEVGLLKRLSADGTEHWALAWDYWDGTLLKAMGGNEAPLLKQAYAISAATLAAQQQGHSVSEEALKDGSVRLTITTY